MTTASERTRSFVDPATNVILVSDFDAATYLAWIKGRPVTGSKLLANFLHEWTHRWCFHSVVGSAMALLRMRAGCRTLLGRSAFDDYVRCMTTSMILEPVAEGLSLFAEFDTYPGKSPWLSQTLTAAGLYFAPALETAGRPLLPLEGLLQTLRRDPLLLERKAGIYCRPVSDPYLLGYLSVKSLWSQMAAACGDLNDRDLFLSYLRSYLYDDYGLVAAILEPAHDEIRAAERIVNHLNSRFRSLLSFQDLESRVTQWLASAEQGEIDPISIGVTAEDKGRAALLLDEALVADAETPEGHNLAAWMLMTLEERSICLIGATSVKLKPATTPDHIDLLLTPEGEPIFTLSAKMPLDRNDGELVLIGTSDAHGMITLLRLEQDILVVSSVGECSEADLELAKRHVANRPLSESLYQEMREKLEETDIASTVWGLIKRQVSGGVEAIYGPLCTLNAKDEVWRDAFEALKRVGVYSLLGEDGELTRALASIGLTNTISTDVGLVRMHGKMLDVEENALEEAIQLGPRHGMQLVVRRGDSVMALV